MTAPEPLGRRKDNLSKIFLISTRDIRLMRIKFQTLFIFITNLQGVPKKTGISVQGSFSGGKMASNQKLENRPRLKTPPSR